MLSNLKTSLIDFFEPFLSFLASFGDWGLFVLSFIESSFFPIPPDFMYIPMILSGYKYPYLLALIASLGSVLGAVFGYYIGLYGGRPLAFGILGKKSLRAINKAEKFFKEYGSIAILIAAFTPIPYKVFTITGGIARMNLLSFIIYSIIGRAARFFAVTFLLVNFGELIMKNFFKLSLIGAFFLVLVFVFLKRSSKTKQSS
jgi:membrane protein YqaA with SNARE-associated domain